MAARRRNPRDEAGRIRPESHACHNRAVVIDAHLSERENKQLDVIQAHGLRNIHLYEGEEWMPIKDAVGDLTRQSTPTDVWSSIPTSRSKRLSRAPRAAVCLLRADGADQPALPGRHRHVRAGRGDSPRSVSVDVAGAPSPGGSILLASDGFSLDGEKFDGLDGRLEVQHAPQCPPLAAGVRVCVWRYPEMLAAPAPPVTDVATRDRLRALGYVQ